MKKRPNIIIFMTDHQRGETIRSDSACITPNIDKFRKTAVNFTSAFCPAPHCCPSRATFFTGLYPSQHGVWNNVSVDNALSRGLFDGVRCFSEDLREAGYRLYFSGKWHVSQVESPKDRGFEIVYHSMEQYRRFENRPLFDGWKKYAKKQQMSNMDDERSDGEIIRPGYPQYRQYGIDENPFHDTDVALAAAAKLRSLKNDTTPFVLYTGPLGPHDPYNVPQRFLDLYPEGSLPLPQNFDDSMEDKPVLYRRNQSRYSQLSRREHQESVRSFYAFCSYEDYLFGLVMNALDESGHRDNTFVLYCSDHGDYVGAHGLWAKGLPCFREAYDICCMAGGAGVANPDRECDAPVSLADWAPTFLEMAGVQATQEYLGQSLCSFLKDEQPESWRRYCFAQSNGNEIYGIQRAVWDKKWKYVYNTFDYDELYDLESDPGELHNLIYGPNAEQGPYSEVIRRMCVEMWRFARDTHDNIVNPYIMTALAPFGPGILGEEMADANPDAEKCVGC